MDYEGKVYRPWPEAGSLLIQTTLGCTHNKCTFCDMFSEKRFRIRKTEEIFKDIDEARQIYPQIKSIFLIDGNVLALKTAFLLKVFEKITSTFPECSKISLYAGDMAAQIHQAFDNLETVLRAAGVQLSDVVRLTYYTTDIKAFTKAGAVLGERLQKGGANRPQPFYAYQQYFTPLSWLKLKRQRWGKHCDHCGN